MKSGRKVAALAGRGETQESRREILRAASRLFASRDFHAASMSEVAKAAGVSKALIFWHFKSKEELFLAVLEHLLEPYRIDFGDDERARDEPAQLKLLVESYLNFVRDNARSVRFFLGRLLRTESGSDVFTRQMRTLYDGYRALLVELISRCQEKGLCSRRLSPQGAASYVLAVLNGFLVDSLFVEDQTGTRINDILGALYGVLFGEMPSGREP